MTSSIEHLISHVHGDDAKISRERNKLGDTWTITMEGRYNLSYSGYKCQTLNHLARRILEEIRLSHHNCTPLHKIDSYATL